MRVPGMCNVCTRNTPGAWDVLCVQVQHGRRREATRMHLLHVQDVCVCARMCSTYGAYQACAYYIPWCTVCHMQVQEVQHVITRIFPYATCMGTININTNRCNTCVQNSSKSGTTMCKHASCARQGYSTCDRPVYVRSAQQRATCAVCATRVT